MSETQVATPTLTTFTKLEAQIMQGFIAQVDYWKTLHGEKADTIEIIYYPEDDGFEVINNEPNNGVLKRNRASIFRTELLSWGVQQIKDLEGWNKENAVKAFTVVYHGSEYGVAVEVAPRLLETALAADVTTDESVVGQ